MLVATRSLTFRQESGEQRLDIRLFSPAQRDNAWCCRYEIDWPEGTKAMEAWGVDAMQSLIMALNMIGTDIYTSSYHKAGALFFEAPGRGYGFPVPANIRDMLIGDDRINEF